MKVFGNARIALAVAITLFLWASAFAGIREALHFYSPGHLALLRYLIASIVLAPVVLYTRSPLPAAKDLPIIAIMGLLGFTVYNAALNYGEVTVTAGAASFLINTAPIFTVLLANIFLGERLKLWGWIGIAISFAGATIIALGEGKGLSFSRDAWLILLAAVAASCYTILQKPLLKRYQPLALTTYVIWAGTLGLSVFAPGLTHTISTAPLNTTLVVVYLGIFPAAIAYVMWTYVLAKIPVSIAVSFVYLIPGMATLIAWLWLHEVPTKISLIGGVLALLGVVVVNTRGRHQGDDKKEDVNEDK